MKASGMNARFAAIKAAVWGTAVECNAGEGVYLNGWSIKRKQDAKFPEEAGLPLPTQMARGAVSVTGKLEAYLRYGNLDLLLAMATGATGGAPAQQGVTAAYLQTFPLTNSLDGLFITLCADVGVNIMELPSVKVLGFEIRGELGGVCEISFDVMANDLEESSAVNTAATFANVTFQTGEAANRVLFSQFAFRMNAQSGAGLGGGDAIYPSKFNFSFSRKMEGKPQAGAATNLIDEPACSGAIEVKLALDWPYTVKTHFTDWAAGTAKKADLIATGSLIEGAYYRQFKLEFPNLEYEDVDLPWAKGRMMHPVQFRCLGCEAAPTGMAVTDPFLLTLINKQTTDVLA